MAPPPRFKRFPMEQLEEESEGVRALAAALSDFAQDTVSALTRALTRGENFAGQEFELTFDSPAAWHEVDASGEPAFQNSWVNYGGSQETAGFRVGHDGRVYLKGQVKGGTINTTVFTLPIGYRPANNQEFASLSGSPALGWVSVNDDGTVVANGSGTNAYVFLNGINFEPVSGVFQEQSPFPLMMRPTFGRRPRNVWLGDIERLDGGNDVAPNTLRWRLTADGQVAIRNVTGLTPSKRYRIRVLME